MRIFWDTNVLVDLLMVRRPFYESASTILTMSEENNWQIIVSSLSVMNANYVCCERGKMPADMLISTQLRYPISDMDTPN